MPTLADQRLLEILDKWLKSLELHERYAGLDNDSYARVQPWPEHQRPSRWVIDIARQKTLALRAQLDERIRRGDTQFSEALEIMTFLANLVGSEHIERFIPLATPENERPLTSAAPAAATGAGASPAAPALAGAAPQTRGHGVATAASRHAPTPSPAPTPAPAPAARVREAAAAKAPASTPGRARAKIAEPPPPPDTAPTREMPMAPIRSDLGSTDTRETLGLTITATREMPQFAAPPPRAPGPVGTAHVARTERRSSGGARAPAASARSAQKANAKHPARMPTAARQPAKAADAAAANAARDAAREQVVADAVRLTQWGRKWYELAELIARMADRPPLPEVRRILKDNKTAIEKKAGRG